MKTKRLKVYVGEFGTQSRALFDGETIPGVSHIRVDVSPDDLSTVTLTVYAKDCEIIQDNFEALKQ